MNIVSLIVQVLGGAVGGNLTGKLVKPIDQGWIINSSAGVVGGGLGARSSMRSGSWRCRTVRSISSASWATSGPAPSAAAS